jgi:hypothetical protein
MSNTEEAYWHGTAMFANPQPTVRREGPARASAAAHIYKLTAGAWISCWVSSELAKHLEHAGLVE